MIRITAELIPFGVGKPRHLGTCVISNDATGTQAVGNYRVRLSMRGRPDSTWKLGKVAGFPRKRLGVWDLMFRALRTIVGDRNREQATNKLAGNAGIRGEEGEGHLGSNAAPI